MRRLFYAMLFIIPFGRLISTSLFESATKAAAVTPDQIILGLLLLVYLMTKRRARASSLFKISVSKPIVFFICWSVVALAVGKVHYDLSLSQVAFGSLYLARWMGYCGLFYIAYDLCRSGNDVRRMITWLVTGSVLFALFGLIQAVFLPDFAFILHPDAIPSLDFDPQGHRLVSTFLDPNIAAGYILIFALLSLSFWIHGYTKWLAGFLLFSVALIATLSRGGILGLVVGILVLMKGKKFPWKRAAWGMVAFGLVCYFMYPTLAGLIQERNRLALTDPSAISRIQDWAIAIEIIIANPVSGIGFNTLGFVLPRFGVIRESAAAFGISGDLVTICVLTGFVGLGLYLWMYVDVVKSLSQLRETTTSNWVRAYARGVQAATIAVLISSSFTTLLLYPQIMAVMWILWAVGARLAQGAKVPIREPAPVLIQVPA